jgi:putative phosphoesterase
LITLGVIADTHIPDRARNLDPQLLSLFDAAQVKAILHAGDVCVPRILDELGEIAPVHAVRGNRDLWALRQLPLSLELEFEGVRIALTHGHGSLSTYLVDKARFYFEGLKEKHFIDRVAAAFPDVNVVIFGHTHLPVIRLVRDILIFNPGSACCPHILTKIPSAGLLHIDAGGLVKGKIITWS